MSGCAGERSTPSTAGWVLIADAECSLLTGQLEFQSHGEQGYLDSGGDFCAYGRRDGRALAADSELAYLSGNSRRNHPAFDC